MVEIYNISIDYVKTINQANKLLKISNKCDDIRSNITKEINYIENNWKGKTGEAFCEKLKVLKNKNKTVSENLDYVASTMKRVAEDIKQADLETSNIIKNLV